MELSFLTISRDKHTQAINVCTHTDIQTRTHRDIQTRTHTCNGTSLANFSSLSPHNTLRRGQGAACVVQKEAAYLLCDLYTHEHLSGLGKRTDPSSHCRYRVMFSALQITIPAAQESSDSSVAMAVSQLLAKSPLLQYKVTTLVSFLHVAMWLASPTGTGTQVTCVITSSGLFSSCRSLLDAGLNRGPPNPQMWLEAQWRCSSSSPQGRG